MSIRFEAVIIIRRKFVLMCQSPPTPIPGIPARAPTVLINAIPYYMPMPTPMPMPPLFIPPIIPCIACMLKPGTPEKLIANPFRSMPAPPWTPFGPVNIVLALSTTLICGPFYA